MSRGLSRRRFLELTGAMSGAALLAMSGCAPQAQPTQAPAAPTAAPAPTATSAPAKAAAPKTLRVRLGHDIRNLDPAFQYSDQEGVVSNCVFNNLVVYKAGTYDVVNDLAETIKASDDGKTITFKLREGVKWHKGYGEVTTEDVKFSYERYAKVDSPYKDDWKVLDQVQIVDKYNGKIILKEAFAPLWHSTLPVERGGILCKKYTEEVGNEKFATNILGSGPYIFTEWQPGQKVILKANPDYFAGKPAFDEIDFFPIEEDKTAEVGYEAGELDFGMISAGSVDRYKADSRFKFLKKPQLGYKWIGMNVESPKLKDINVRQAIRYAIDVPSILKASYLGQVDQEYTLLAPGLLGNWADAPKYTRDVAKAKEFMAKAGLKSLDLRIDIIDNSEYRPYGEVSQQNLKDIGINLTINPLDETSFWSIGEGDKGKDLELFCNSYTMMPDPAWGPMWFTCEQIGIWNWMRWCSKEFDDLHAKGMVTLDDKEREKIYIKMQQMWDAACHTVWITHSAAFFVHTPTIKGYLTPHGLPQVRWITPA